MSNAEFLAVVKSQYGGALNMFDAALKACPADQWDNPEHAEPFWNTAYHTLFYTDLYLGMPEHDLVEQPFHFEGAQWLPGQGHDDVTNQPREPVSKEDMLTYAAFIRERLDTVMTRLVDVNMGQPCPFTWLDMIIPEALLYNLRHLQHHTSQMILMMQQAGALGSVWSGKG